MWYNIQHKVHFTVPLMVEKLYLQLYTDLCDNYPIILVHTSCLFTCLSHQQHFIPSITSTNWSFSPLPLRTGIIYKMRRSTLLPLTNFPTIWSFCDLATSTTSRIEQLHNLILSLHYCLDFSIGLCYCTLCVVHKAINQNLINWLISQINYYFVMHLSMSSPTPQVRVMLGFRWGFELWIFPKGQGIWPVICTKCQILSFACIDK